MNKFPAIQSRKLAITGAVVVIGLILVLVYITYHLFYTETKRIDASTPPASAVPVEPSPGPVSPESGAPSAAKPGDGAAPPATQ